MELNKLGAFPLLIFVFATGTNTGWAETGARDDGSFDDVTVIYGTRVVPTRLPTATQVAPGSRISEMPQSVRSPEMNGAIETSGSRERRHATQTAAPPRARPPAKSDLHSLTTLDYLRVSHVFKRRGWPFAGNGRFQRATLNVDTRDDAGRLVRASRSDWLRPLSSETELNLHIAANDRGAGGDDEGAGTGEEAKTTSGSALVDKAARETVNPLGGDFIIWFNLFNVGWFEGDLTDKTRYGGLYQFQPVIPINVPQIGEHWVWVNRPTVNVALDQSVPTVPSATQPGVFEFDRKGGLGDVEYFTLLGTSIPTKSGWAAENMGEGHRVLAAGFTTRWPTGRDNFTDNVYALGPAFTMAYVGNKWVLGTLIQHWWSIKKTGGADDTSRSTFQYFYFRNFEGGWQIGGSPTWSVNWKGESGDRLSMPLGIGVFKTFLVGKNPLRLGVEMRPFLDRPDSFGSDWAIEFSITPLTPNFFANLFK